MGNVCTITQCRRKRDHQVIPESFQENGVQDEKISSPPESRLSESTVSSDSGTVRSIEIIYNGKILCQTTDT